MPAEAGTYAPRGVLIAQAQRCRGASPRAPPRPEPVEGRM